MNADTTQEFNWDSKLFPYAVIKENGEMHGMPVLVPLSKIMHDCAIATEQGRFFDLHWGIDPRTHKGLERRNIFTLRIHNFEQLLPDADDM